MGTSTHSIQSYCDIFNFCPGKPYIQEERIGNVVSTLNSITPVQSISGNDPIFALCCDYLNSAKVIWEKTQLTWIKNCFSTVLLQSTVLTIYLVET